MKLDELTAKGRKHIAPSNFVFPKEKRFPIHDLAHARNALARSAGTPDEAKVKAAVYKKYPALKERAMKASENMRFRLEPKAIRLTEGDDGVKVPNRIQLFRTGTFKKLMPNGQTLTFSITKDTLREMQENWAHRVRGQDIALDFAHKADEEAAGWFTNVCLEADGNELWAEIEWTPDGYAAVAGKKFRYVSPDFAFAWTDNETGEKYGATLFGAGLTNRPVIKNMAPTVELTEVETMATPAKKFSEMSKEELELRLAEEKDEEKKELIQLRLDEMAASEDDGADDEDSDDDGDEDDGGTSGSDEGDGEKKAAPKKKPAPKSGDEQNFDELKKAHEKLLQEVADMKKHAAKQLAESTFAKLLAEGKVVAAQKDAFLAGDTVKFAELSQSVKFSTLGAEGSAVSKADTSAQDEVLKLAEKKVEAGAKRTEAVSLVLAENPELFARYQKEMEGDSAE